MDDYISKLIKIGFSKNEAKVYLALIGHSKATAKTIINQLKVHRNIVYDNLNKLMERGVVSFSQESGIKQFYAHNPDSISDYYKEKKKELDEKISEIESISENLKHFKLSTNEHEAHIFQGVQGIKKVLKLFLNLKGSTQKVMGITNASTEILGKTFWDNYNRKIIDNQIKELILINKEYDEKTFMTESPNTFIRYLPPELSQNVEAIIHPEMVALFVYTHNPTALLIKEKSICAMFEAQFDFLWNQLN